MENWELIAKYLAEECSEDEKQTLESWLEEDTANQQSFEKLKHIWQKASDSKPRFEPNVDSALDKVRHKANLQPPQTKVRKLDFSSFNTRLVAAVFVLFTTIFALFFLQRSFNPEYAWVNISTQSQDTLSVVLADGSKVWLNKNSNLKFPKKFGDQLREVFLEGEAFFEVVSNPQKPFIIRSHEASTEVLGTSFQVNAKPEAKDVEVQVVSGKVALYDTKTKTNKVILNPGNKGILNRDDLAVQKVEEVNNNQLAWKTGKLSFSNTSLKEVSKVLADYYQIEIKLESEAIANCPITVEFDHLGLEDVIKIIQATLPGIYFEVSPDGYLIRGEGCNSE